MGKIRVTGLRAGEFPARIILGQSDDVVVVDAEGYADLMTRLALAARTLGWTNDAPPLTPNRVLPTGGNNK